MFVAELKLTGKMQDRRLSARRQGFHPSPTHKAINHILPSDHYFSSVSYKHSSSIKWNMSFPRLLDFLVRTVEGNICRHMACRLHLEKHFENWTWTFFSPIMCRWSGLLTLNHFSGNYFSWSYTSVYMTLGFRDVWVFLYYYCSLSQSQHPEVCRWRTLHVPCSGPKAMGWLRSSWIWSEFPHQLVFLPACFLSLCLWGIARITTHGLLGIHLLWEKLTMEAPKILY